MQDALSVESRLAQLERDGVALRRELLDLDAEISRRFPNTSLLSNSLVLRSLAVWGHYLVGQILIAIPIAFIVATLFLLMFRVR